MLYLYGSPCCRLLLYIIAKLTTKESFCCLFSTSIMFVSQVSTKSAQYQQYQQHKVFLWGEVFRYFLRIYRIIIHQATVKTTANRALRVGCFLNIILYEANFNFVFYLYISFVHFSACIL